MLSYYDCPTDEATLLAVCSSIILLVTTPPVAYVHNATCKTTLSVQRSAMYMYMYNIHMTYMTLLPYCFPHGYTVYVTHR